MTGGFRVEQDVIRHPDGSVAAVFRTGQLDVEALDATRSSVVLGAFSRLCHTLDVHLQLLVRVRRLCSSESHDASPDDRELERAMRECWAAHAHDSIAHTRDVLVAIRAQSSEALAHAGRRVLDTTQAMGMDAERLSDAALLGVLTESDSDDQATVLGWVAHPQHVLMESQYVRGYSMQRLPGHPVAAGWLAPLLRVQVECDIAIHLVPASLGEALNTLGRRMRDFSAHRMLESERGVIGDVHIDIGMDSAIMLRNRLARNSGRPLHLSVTATVRAPTLTELHRRSETVRHAFSAALMTAQAAHFRHLSAYMTTLPLACDELHEQKLVESNAAATCFPWVESGCADPGGYRVGVDVRSDVPVAVAPFDTRRHMNANIAVFAASGHGKSFLLGTLVLEAAMRGAGTVIVDPEGEYRQVVATLGGSYLDLKPGGSVAVNVFDTIEGNSEEALAAVTDLISVMCGSALSEVQRAHVEAAAREAQQRALAGGRAPVLGDCLPSLEANARDVSVVLRRFCSGALGTLFNRPTSMSLETDVCAISLRDIADDLIPATTLIVARWLWNLIRRDRKRRHIVFDEVGALCEHPAMRGLLVQLARRCRKYGASLIVATQNSQDLLASSHASVIATNCAVVFLGGHRPAETARMEQAFGLTEAQRRFLEGAARGEFLLIAGDRRVGVHVRVPALHQRILTAPLDG
jgi:hypothetical protein